MPEEVNVTESFGSSATGDSGNNIWSESQFIYHLLKDILLLPITLLLVLFRKKEFGELFRPLKDLWKFLTDAKMTFALIVACIAVSVGVRLFYYLNGFAFFNNFWEYSAANPAALSFGVNSHLLYPAEGLLEGPIFLIPFFVAAFMHAYGWHLIGNVVGLFIFGRVVEKKIGAFKLLLIYFAAHIVGLIATSLVDIFYFHTAGVHMGASLALFGIMAAAIILNPFYITFNTIIPLPIIVVVIADMAIQFINAHSGGGGGDVFGHLFGFVGGFLIVLLLSRKNFKEVKLGLIFSMIGLALALVLAMNLDTSQLKLPNILDLM